MEMIDLKQYLPMGNAYVSNKELPRVPGEHTEFPWGRIIRLNVGDGWLVWNRRGSCRLLEDDINLETIFLTDGYFA